MIDHENRQAPPGVKRIDLSHGAYVERETKTTGEPGWLLCAPDGTAVRGLNAYEAEFIDSALRAASAPTQPVQQPAPPVQRWQDRYNHGVGSPAKIECMRLEIEDWRALFATLGPAASVQLFQQRVQPWMMACFGAEISADKDERNHRFFEESTELVQASGMTASEAHQLVDYVYGRPVGEPAQEVGGVMVTLAALCLAQDMDMHVAGETELARIWTKVDTIRAKQAAKPKHSPLPAPPNAEVPIEAALAAFCDKEGYPSDGPMDGVLRKAFAAGASFAFDWKGGA